MCTFCKSQTANIGPNPERASYARCRVQVYGGARWKPGRVLMGTSVWILVLHAGTSILEAPVKRKLQSHAFTESGINHPWKGKFRTYFDKEH